MKGRNKSDIIAEIMLIIIVMAVLILKLTGILQIDWWIIASPFLLAFGLGILLFLFFISAMLVKDIINIIRRNIK